MALPACLLQCFMMVISTTGKALGAEVQGVDLKNISDADFDAVHRAWLDHLVLLFRGQQLTNEDLIAFSRRFGNLDWAPIQETGRRFVDGYPEIYVVSNVVENGVPIGSLPVQARRSGTPICRIWKIRPKPACCTLWKSLPEEGTPGSAICIWRMNAYPTSSGSGFKASM